MWTGLEPLFLLSLNFVAAALIEVMNEFDPALGQRFVGDSIIVGA